MEGLILLLAAVAILVMFDLAAAVLGADSRETIGDDHARPISS